MKSNIFCLLLFIIFSLQTNLIFCQNTIRLTNLQNPKRVVEIRKKNYVSLRYLSVSEKSRFGPLIRRYRGNNFSEIQGKVISIDDTLLCIRKATLFKKKIINVPIDSILQIRRDRFGVYALYGAGLSVTSIPFFIYTTVNPVLLAIPYVLVGGYVGEKVIFPLKNVDENVFRKRNRWKLEVLSPSVPSSVNAHPE